MGNEAMRNIAQDRIKTAEFEVDATSLEVGSNALSGATLPDLCLIIGAYLKNPADDLASASTTATTAVTVGGTTVLSATGKAAIKGKGVGALDTSPNSETSGAVALVQAGEVYTAGTLTAGVLYV